jgi:hypothetical protein
MTWHLTAIITTPARSFCKIVKTEFGKFRVLHGIDPSVLVKSFVKFVTTSSPLTVVTTRQGSCKGYKLVRPLLRIAAM